MSPRIKCAGVIIQKVNNLRQSFEDKQYPDIAWTVFSQE
jgi:hypothetical protein